MTEQSRAKNAPPRQNTASEVYLFSYLAFLREISSWEESMEMRKIGKLLLELIKKHGI